MVMLVLCLNLSAEKSLDRSVSDTRFGGRLEELRTQRVVKGKTRVFRK